ncbi:MBL fold metallo-hydrolase [Cyclobacterium plantarum]|uniref:MBL fold metallo-hydrolase n=1 Tax=Cyclobacterium plantarum TaxID=2716263 RepID=UPI003F726D82
MAKFIPVFRRFMLISFTILVIFATAALLFLQQPQFGKAPHGERLERIKQSPNYKEGSFKNLYHTPFLSEGYSMTKITLEFIFKNFPRTSPMDTVPGIKTDLKAVPKDENILIWFGHSSYFIQLNGIRFLVDPVFSGRASPVPYSTQSFAGTDIYTVEDFPEIDYLLISHDHYDHLDYSTILKLEPKIHQVVCGLGVGEHFEYWGYDPAKIVEKDWDERLKIGENFTLHTATSRHFSGRSLKRSNTLWMSFVLQSKDYTLYVGGDSGYDTHFKELGKKFSGFDLAILDNGQYNEGWKELHMFSHEVLQAGNDLNAKRIMPVHSGKFTLANHPWDEPLETIVALNEENFHCPIVTPRIGEVVMLNDSTQTLSRWWRGMK